MSQFRREVSDIIKKRLFQGKVIILYGARQVGKTTLTKKILAEYGDQGAYFNCEIGSVASGLSNTEPEQLRAFLGKKLIVLDEAQVIPEIGKKLKLLIDTFPEIQVIATGSSSFDLAERTTEPLTGRAYTFLLYPLATGELIETWGVAGFEERLEILLRFGCYPEVVGKTEQEAREHLDTLVSQYLYKDVLQLGEIRKPLLIQDLVTLLALQLGQEVSYNELATNLGISRITVEKYIDILEKAFVLFRLRAFSRNQRKEVRKTVKVYFYDLGIRNSIIQNFNTLETRADVGALWENFCLLERMKAQNALEQKPNRFFWRSYAQQEVDYVEEQDGVLRAFEFKYSGRENIKTPSAFLQEYDVEVELVSRKKYRAFLLLQ